MAVNPGDGRSVSVVRLIASLWLAGLVAGAGVGFAYVSLLLVAPLAGLGVPATAGLAAAFLIRTEQTMTFWVSRWRPPLLLLAVSALPATAVAFALRALFHWQGSLGIVFAVTAGLLAQALALHHLTAALARRIGDGECGVGEPGHDAAVD